jgi:outer membrane lipoprotein carrier protein
MTGPTPASRILLHCLLLVLATAVPSAPSMAGGREALLAFQQQVHTLHADFRQVLRDETGAVVQASSGTVVLARPDRFRWDYTDPYEQVIVSDGGRVWFYDADLEQVTVKPLDEAVTGSGALLLSGERPIEEVFRVEDREGEGGLAWVALTPRQSGAGFERLRLAFDGPLPRVMVLEDAFGQTTRLDFSAVERNPELPTDAFDFVPPPGVDVIHAE